VRYLFSTLTCCFAIFYVGALILLINGRIGILSLCSFSCAFSAGGEGLFWFKYFICVYLRFYCIFVMFCVLVFGISQ
jgi:hypothetical protein